MGETACGYWFEKVFFVIVLRTKGGWKTSGPFIIYKAGVCGKSYCISYADRRMLSQIGIRVLIYQWSQQTGCRNDLLSLPNTFPFL